MKRIMYLVFVLYISLSCGMKGPNYNQGVSHNQDRARRLMVVYKEDKRMKNAMVRERKRASRGARTSSKSKAKGIRRII